MFRALLRALLTAGAVAALAAAAGVAHAEPAIRAETFFVPSTDPAIRLHVRNKRPADADRFDEDHVVVFVHGATYPSESAFDLALPGGSWMDWIAARGFDVYAMDVRGYGRSTRTAESGAQSTGPAVRTPEAIDDVAAVLEFVRRRTGAARVNLVGWSWGTALMAGYTARHNERVKRLALFAPLWIFRDPSALGARGEFREIRRADARRRSLESIPAGRAGEISPAAWFDQWWAANLAARADAGRGAGPDTPSALRVPNGALKDVEEYWMSGRPTWEPSDIRVPVLLVLGEWDRDTPPYMAQSIYDRLDNTPYRRQVVLREGTHAMPLEKNRLSLMREVQSFLETTF
jgi:pimeloyl-ACP methyl ester carboxylesterase